ncbi:FkbM family methyltransferase [Marixanthomonas ophiurae]|uniref:FkbM family methyltransferase n=1 Tax=Marixanthomonas ophiurae TaxID=387659 RepID=A0A3E1QD73_9FLAO|nr:FkbM family methyltransferase [Marixanthomonas ophiurae]RFN60044.1 FkbM family methyltransferase [Marixanthomonas ophiurae]
MKKEKLKSTDVEVRDIRLKLMTYTRSLELCARMNYETENLDFIDTMKPADVLYDLGACEGRFSIYAALKGIKVISFEPETRNFLVFSQNIEINKLDKDSLKAINAGVGAKNGNATIKIGQPWEGGHQKIVEHGETRNDLDFNFVESQEIKIVSLDSFLTDSNHPFPDYLKIDIDGSEMPFLLGATKTLNSKSLKGIIFELNEQDPNFKNIILFLNKAGLIENKRFEVPNEPYLYNIVFERES